MKINNHYALNPIEIQKIAGVPIKVMRYSDLINFKRLEDMFSTNCKCVLILFEQRKRFGHWCCLINHKKKVIFFDPYALMPDDQLQFTNIKFRNENNMRLPYLTYLLYKCKKQIDYNDKQFQKMDENINTCGYHCGFRMRNNKLDSDQYIKLFKGIPLNELDNIIIEICGKYI